MARPIHSLIFDGHNDVLSRHVHKQNARSGFANGIDGHIDLVKAKSGGFGGGFFAIYVHGDPAPDNENIEWGTNGLPYDVPLPPPVSQKEAIGTVLAQAALLAQLEQDSSLKICTTVVEIRNCLDNGQMAAIMHLEGAEAIDTNFDALEILYRAGLRSLGPVWSRPTDFGHGVPFRYPADPDIGPGLSEKGKALIKQCNQLGIMIDLSHLNEAGFWDVVELSDAPLVATHSNVHAICPSSRNLTDRQLGAIKDSDGMVGLNFGVAFLRPDGQKIANTGFDIMLTHLDYLLEHLGENRVGLGSDFDGTMIPAAIGDVSGLPALTKAMAEHGYGEALIRNICHENWLNLLERTWIG